MELTLNIGKICRMPENTQPTLIDTKQKDYLALILALTAFVLSTLPLTMPFLEIFYIISKEGIFYRYVLHFLMPLGWLPGLLIAIVAFKMGRRMKDGLLRNFTRNISLLTIIGSLCLGILEILAPLMIPFTPGW